MSRVNAGMHRIVSGAPDKCEEWVKAREALGMGSGKLR